MSLIGQIWLKLFVVIVLAFVGGVVPFFGFGTY